MQVRINLFLKVETISCTPTVAVEGPCHQIQTSKYQNIASYWVNCIQFLTIKVMKLTQMTLVVLVVCDADVDDDMTVTLIIWALCRQLLKLIMESLSLVQWWVIIHMCIATYVRGHEDHAIMTLMNTLIDLHEYKINSKWGIDDVHLPNGNTEISTS